MNIDPTATQIWTPSYSPIGVWFDDEEDEVESNQSRALAGPSGATSLAGIEKQFAQLVRDLTQQLAHLQRQLSQALKALGAAQAKTPACDPDVCPQGEPGSPRMQRYGTLITGAAHKYEVDPLLVSAVIRQESGFSSTAMSKTGAMGLMQLMPETAQALGVHNAFDPQQNIEGGTALLRQLLDRYHGQVDLALAAYNAGSAAVDKYGGIPPYPETQAYVRNVMEIYRESALS